MANLQGIKDELAKKLKLSDRSINRRIKDKEDATLQPRTIAALMVAVEAGVSVKKFATDDELAQVRAAIAGQSSSTPSDAPATVPTSTPVAARAARRTSGPSTLQRRRKGKTVFVVHGRNEPLRKAMFEFLRAVGLNPMEWSSALRATESGTPTIMQVIEVLLRKSASVVVLLTPDDLVMLKPQLVRKSDKGIEKQLVGQARPNVLFEAGIAMGSMPRETVLVEIGDIKDFTDVGGIHVMRLNNSSESRNTFIQKLEAANCDVDSTGTDWLSAGDFEQETHDG